MSTPEEIATTEPHDDAALPAGSPMVHEEQLPMVDEDAPMVELSAAPLLSAPSPPGEDGFVDEENPPPAAPGAVPMGGDETNPSSAGKAEKEKEKEADTEKKPVPGPTTKKKKIVKKKKREINPKFKDVQETGKWGEISQKEVYVASAVAILVLIGVVVGIVVGLSGEQEVVEETRAPTAAPTILPAQWELILALDAINLSEQTYENLLVLPTDAEDYLGLADEGTPQERAMSWLLWEDDLNLEADNLGERWALASIYFSLGGENWDSAEGWLSGQQVCDWEHVLCNPVTRDIQEIVLSNNNLVGTIPVEFAMLTTVQSVWLRANRLTGPIPSKAFGSMPKLGILYLDNNQLTGTISTDIRDNGVLNSLFLQANDLTGEWPRTFCALTPSGFAPVENFGIDCDEVACPQAGCCSQYNCYFDE